MILDVIIRSVTTTRWLLYFFELIKLRHPAHAASNCFANCVLSCMQPMSISSSLSLPLLTLSCPFSRKKFEADELNCLVLLPQMTLLQRIYFFLTNSALVRAPAMLSIPYEFGCIAQNTHNVEMSSKMSFCHRIGLRDLLVTWRSGEGPGCGCSYCCQCFLNCSRRPPCHLTCKWQHGYRMHQESEINNKSETVGSVAA